METFTTEEVIALLCIGFIVGTILICIIKGFFKVAIAIFIAAVLFGFGFGWLPAQIEAVKNGDKTKEELTSEIFTKETLDESLSISKDYYDKNKNTIFGTIESAFTKIGNILFPSETPPTEPEIPPVTPPTEPEVPPTT